MKRQFTEREKIFANHFSDKGLISRIFKRLLQLKSEKKKKKFKKLLKKWTKDLNRHLSKKTYKRPTGTFGGVGREIILVFVVAVDTTTVPIVIIIRS